MKKPKVMHALLNEEYEADFILEFKKNEKGEPCGVLTVPYVAWATPKESFLAFRVLPIEGRLLECIEKYFFDKHVAEISIQDYPSPIEICDIYYQVIPPEIYEQILSGTFIEKPKKS